MNQSLLRPPTPEFVACLAFRALYIDVTLHSFISFSQQSLVGLTPHCLRYIPLHIPDPYATSCGIHAHVPLPCNDTWNLMANRTNGRWYIMTIHGHKPQNCTCLCLTSLEGVYGSMHVCTWFDCASNRIVYTRYH